MKFEDLTPEQMEKARACKTPEDMLNLAHERFPAPSSRWFKGELADGC